MSDAVGLYLCKVSKVDWNAVTTLNDATVLSINSSIVNVARFHCLLLFLFFGQTLVENLDVICLHCFRINVTNLTLSRIFVCAFD